MKWTKENKERLCGLLDGVDDHEKLKNLGVEIVNASPGAKGGRHYILIPITHRFNKSQLIRLYISKYPKASQQKIIRMIRDHYMINVKPALVSVIRASGVSSYQGDSSLDKVDHLKIPKDIAEKFLILGVP